MARRGKMPRNVLQYFKCLRSGKGKTFCRKKFLGKK